MGNQKLEMSVNSQPVLEAYGDAASNSLLKREQVSNLSPVSTPGPYCYFLPYIVWVFTIKPRQKSGRQQQCIRMGKFQWQNGYILTSSHKLSCLSTFNWAAAKGNATHPLLLDHH